MKLSAEDRKALREVLRLMESGTEKVDCADSQMPTSDCHEAIRKLARFLTTH